MSHLAPGSDERHHERIRGSVGQLVPPHPNRHRTRICEGQQDVWRHDEGVNISGDDDILLVDMRMVFLGQDPDQLGGQNTGEFTGLHEADRGSQLFQVALVVSKLRLMVGKAARVDDGDDDPRHGEMVPQLDCSHCCLTVWEIILAIHLRILAPTQS